MYTKKTIFTLAIALLSGAAYTQEIESTAPVPEVPPVATSELSPSQPSKDDKSGVSLSSDILFAFAGSGLTADSKMLLDRIIPRLKALEIEVILATGHADRIGSDAFNEKLSLSRAVAVRDYLVANGIPADKIKVDARGSSEPVTSQEECQSKKGVLLQNCLSPDRRVNLVAQGFTRSGSSMPTPDGRAQTETGVRKEQLKFTVFFRGTSVLLTSADNDLLDEIADAAMEAERVHLRGKTAAAGSPEQKKARAIGRAWSVRQGLVFRGVEAPIRVFYQTRGLNPKENNERVDVEIFPKKD
jgi:outer membrane protein OmpA-like peptidoglycan-associated protein